MKEELLAQLIEKEEENILKSGNIVKILKGVLTVSFDMGWNKHSSGKRYDSIYDHAVLIEGKFKKVIPLCVLSMKYHSNYI